MNNTDYFPAFRKFGLILATGILLTACNDGDPAPCPAEQQPQAISGRVNTYNKFSFKYGRMDVYAKLPRTANGLWPAIWLLGSDYNGYTADGKKASGVQKVNWPECAEIDVMEMGSKDGIAAGAQDRFLTRGTHWGSNTQGNNHPAYAINNAYSVSLQDGFHLFVLVRNQSMINMYLDPQLNEDLSLAPGNSPYYAMDVTKSDGPYPVAEYFHKDFFILLNLAVGGEFPGIYDINQLTALNAGNGYKADMYIDFVRVLDDKGKVVWLDEFDKLDATKWNIEENSGGGGNNELQAYSQQGVAVGVEPASNKNCLILTAKRNDK